MSNSRSQAEIERDFKKIRKYVKENEVKSITEIANALGLSASQVNTSLSKHPRVQKEIMDIIAKNNESEKKESDQNDIDRKGVTNTPVRFVIDASITGVEGIQDVITQICIINSRIVLTSLTIRELERMKGFLDICGRDARWILATAANNPNLFECVLIDEKFENPDENIIKYCQDNKENCVLMTADNAMALKGRAFGIKVRVFKKSDAKVQVPKVSRERESAEKSTLRVARMIEGNLFITEFESEKKMVRVISNGIEYNSGKVRLRIGDDVFIAVEKEEFISFVHLRVKTLGFEDNCVFVYGKRVRFSNDINSMPRAAYKSFMRDAKRKFDN